jgi:hypothetical protein
MLSVKDFPKRIALRISPSVSVPNNMPCSFITRRTPNADAFKLLRASLIVEFLVMVAKFKAIPFTKFIVILYQESSS